MAFAEFGVVQSENVIVVRRVMMGSQVYCFMTKNDNKSTIVNQLQSSGLFVTGG